MVAYSFQPEFVDPIRAGTKCQTIRADRKRHARAGEQLQLYRGMRTRGCFLIGRAVCLSAQPIRIMISDEEALRHFHTIELPMQDKRIRWRSDLDDFAVQDGFSHWPAMQKFWREHHPEVTTFFGVLIRWHQFGLPA